MSRLPFFVLLALITTPLAYAQSVGISGYVKAENIYDTRQVAQVREGQFHLYPLPDTESSRTDNLVYASFQSRIRITGSGTQALGANLSGVVEADFFGTANDYLGQFRLRHAFVLLDWGREQLMFGQYWSPLFTVAVFPQTIAFNTGAPFQPFARFGQIRFTIERSGVRFITALSQQRDAFSDIGGNKLQQQAAVPAGHLHVQIPGAGRLVGGGVYLKSIRPALTSDRFTAASVQGYALIEQAPLAVRAKVTYGSDLTDHLMTGGFLTLEDGSFQPLRVGTAWIDVSWSSGGPVAFGVFGGYLMNLGAGQDVTVLLDDTDGDGTGDREVKATRADNMERLWRVAPRATYSTGRLRFAIEGEVTSALFASDRDSDYGPVSIDPDESVTNVRGHLAVYYFF
ncbi:MAG: hypothetical protein R3178_06730 [Rhodothermales bacterium]|nr:hypothetical protein [Rhodothermales bacterium]